MAHEYTKNLWSSGDVITATKLNLIDDELVELNEDVAALEQSVDSTLTAAQNMVDDAVEQLTQTVNDSNANLAAAYDENSTYNVGDYVVYNNSLWRCNIAIEEPEEWTPAHWGLTFMGRELSFIIKGEQPNSWDDVQFAVQKGYGPYLYPVGTQFIVNHDTYGDIIFDVVSHNHHKNPNNINAPTMTLMSEYVLYPFAFDDKEPIYIVTEENYPNGLPAGTYNLLIPAGYTLNSNQWTGIEFTLQKPVPVGGCLLFGAWTTNDISTRTLTSYTAVIGGTTLNSSIPLQNVTNNSISLGTMKYNNDSATNYINHIDRARYASSNWKECNLRQWLITPPAASNWWTQQTPFDRLDSTYNNKANFQYGLDENFLNIVGPVDVITQSKGGFEQTINDSSITYYITRDKFFIPSLQEINLNLQEFSLNMPFTAYENAKAANRIKYQLNSTTARQWATRSPDTKAAIWDINTKGNAVTTNSSGDYSVSICCVIY